MPPFLITFAAFALLAVVDWNNIASMVNTVLLIVLAIMNQANGHKVAKVQEKVDEVHASVPNVAASAASAATAAATTLRILQENGGAVRHVEVPTVPTENTGT